VAQEVADVLTHKDYKGIVQDYDIPFAPNSYQDLAGIDDSEECKRRIIAANRADRRVLRHRCSPFCRRAGLDSRMLPGTPKCSQRPAMAADGKQGFREFRCTPDR
jgi:hypothetical protein